MLDNIRKRDYNYMESLDILGEIYGIYISSGSIKQVEH